MSNMSKQIRNIESNLFNVELAIDSAGTRKEQDELQRKRNKFRKKLRKLKRRADNKDDTDNDTDWI